MCEALGNPPFGRDPPPLWLPKWEEGEGHGCGRCERAKATRLAPPIQPLAVLLRSFAGFPFMGVWAILASVRAPSRRLHAQNGGVCGWNHRSGFNYDHRGELRQRFDGPIR